VVTVSDSLSTAKNHNYYKVITDEITIRPRLAFATVKVEVDHLLLHEPMVRANGRALKNTVSLVETLTRKHGMKMVFTDSTPVVERGISHA
jgi:hypothetical protein